MAYYPKVANLNQVITGTYISATKELWTTKKICQYFINQVYKFTQVSTPDDKYDQFNNQALRKKYSKVFHGKKN